jgi:hypothetical protein
MDNQPQATVPQVGQTVFTIFGEQLTVLEVRQPQPVTKKGVPVGTAGEVMVLAQSGEAKCWFPLSRLRKEPANG